MSSTTVTPPVVKAKAISCPNCGGPVELRGFAHTLSVVCPGCGSVLDTTTPVIQILQRVQQAQRIHPPLPMGSRGKFENTVYEVIGFQVRAVQGEDPYEWNEYVLFNPYKGFRYLSEFQGHWNFIRVLSTLPDQKLKIGRRAVTMAGVRYRHFDHAAAMTSYVLGEFPWRAYVGEQAQVDDYIAPPYMLSSEVTAGEAVWSRGEYYTSEQIWRTFQLKTPAPRTSGMFANKPSPYAGRVGSAWRLWLWLTVALAVVMFFFSFTAANKVVFEQSYSFSPHDTSEPSFVTDVFDVKGGPDNIEVDIKTNLDNNWAYFNLALIDPDTGHGYDFGKEVSYYYGTDSDGSWTEGGRRGSVKVPSVMPGRYYLRIEPEMDANAQGMQYDIVVRRGVLSWAWIWMAALLLVIPPLFMSIRAARFEGARWRESDYAPSGG